jgi:hypothetical protein
LIVGSGGLVDHDGRSGLRNVLASRCPRKAAFLDRGQEDPHLAHAEIAHPLSPDCMGEIRPICPWVLIPRRASSLAMPVSPNFRDVPTSSPLICPLGRAEISEIDFLSSPYFIENMKAQALKNCLWIFAITNIE